MEQSGASQPGSRFDTDIGYEAHFPFGYNKARPAYLSDRAFSTCLRESQAERSER